MPAIQPMPSTRSLTESRDAPRQTAGARAGGALSLPFDQAAVPVAIPAPTFVPEPTADPASPTHAASPAGDLGPIWQRALTALKRLAGRSAVDTWLLKVELLHLRPAVDPDLAGDGVNPARPGGALVEAELRAVDDQVAIFVRDHHLPAIEAALAQVLGPATRVRASIAAGGVAPLTLLPADPVQPLYAAPELPAMAWSVATRTTSLAATAPQADQQPWADLVERFTFERFVIGKANELAASVGSAICQAPGQLYNPLFVHGGVGLGKTHLLHAIGHRLRALRPTLRVRYVAAETYIDDVYAAWRSKDGASRQDVRAHYRDGADVLLLDDAQFLQGNDKIGEEFFHLFNALHHAGKQIVLSADRYPSELQGLHERLRSRMQWGLVAELAPPDRELRVALLRHKALELQLVLPADVVFYLADHLCNNVRELEGALHKLSAHARMGRRAIDLSLARAALGPMIEMPSRNLTAEVIQRVTAQHFGIKVTDLKGAKRHRTVVVPRMIAMYLVRKHTSASLPDIGRLFGGRDHTTVLHGCRKMDYDIARKPDIQAAVQAIETALGK